MSKTIRFARLPLKMVYRSDCNALGDLYALEFLYQKWDLHGLNLR